MSRKWNIKCTVCADPNTPPHLDGAVLRLGEGSNHNEEGVVALAKAAKEIATLGKALPDVRVQFNLALSAPAFWFTQHDGHKLAVVSEYGELSDEYWPEGTNATE